MQEESRTRKRTFDHALAQQSPDSSAAHAEKLASLGRHFLGIIHELSNPLTSILGNAQRLLQQAGSELPEARRILAEAERASSILRQLLFFSRDSRAASERLSLPQLVAHTVELQLGSFASENPGSPRLLLEIAEALPPAEGDYAQLQQVLLNLLQNARQAIELSGCGSAVGVRTALAPGGTIQLEVWDDGPGIPADIQPRIFEPFFTTKPAGVGTGLGLSIVQSFVRQHGGTVTYHSRSPAGSRFLVDLPVAQKASVGPLSPVPERLFPPRAVPPRALILEDEPTVAALIADVLRDQGMNVDVLQTGQSALQQAQAHSYELIICDIKMPGLDGPAFYESLPPGNHSLRHRVLFVTGDLLASRTREFLEKNRLPHLAKPFRIEELIRAVQQLLRGKKSAASA